MTDKERYRNCLQPHIPNVQQRAPVVIVPVYRTRISCTVLCRDRPFHCTTRISGWRQMKSDWRVWIGIAPIEERMELVHKMLDLPENIKKFSLFAMGYPAEERPQQDRFDPERYIYGTGGIR